MTTYTNLSNESVDGVIESSIQGLLLGSLSTMPTASEKYEGCIVLYIGTTGTYTNSRFYQCTKSGSTYSWTELTVADSPSLEGYVPTSRKVAGHALTADVSISASDVSAIPSSYLSTATPSETSTDSQVPTSKAVFDALSGLSVGYIIEVSVSLSTGSGSLSDIAITATASGYDTLTGTTDSSGFCSLKGAIAGVTYTVTGTKDTYAVTSATVKIEHLVNEVSISTYKYGQLTVSQTPVSGTVSITGGEYTQSGNVYFLVPGTTYTVAVSQVSGYVKPANQTATLTAGQERTITFTHVAYPKVTVNQSGATGTVSCSPTPFAVSENVYTLLPETSYVFSVSQVSGYLKPANQTVSYNAGTTNTITFAHITLPKLTVSVTDPNKTSAITVSATNGTETVTGIVNASSGTGSVTLTVNYVGSYEISIPNPPTGGSATTVTATAVGGSTVNAGTIVVSYSFGFTIVQIAEGTSDPYNRVSYPTSVTINGKTYTNSIPSTGFTEARGTSLNGWAVADNACSKLIEGIRPVALNGSSWVTSGYSLTDSTGWSSSYDWFTEFPFRWMAWYKTGSTVYIIFSDKSENPDSTIFQDYAFLNNSNVRKPNMHIGCFDGTNTSNVLYSKRTGANPTVNVSITNFIAYAEARGTDFDIITFYQAMYVTGLFITLYKTTDCQGYSNSSYGLGKGYVGGSSVQTIVGLAFDNNYGMYGDRSGTTSRVSFFWIHDIWGNIFDFVGGAKTDSNRRLMTQTGKVSSVTDSDFNNTALTSSLSSSLSGYVTAIAGGQKTGPFPTTASGGSGTTYFSDDCFVYTSNFPVWGGYYGYTDRAGLFYWRFNYSATETGGDIGSRLSYKGGRT